MRSRELSISSMTGFARTVGELQTDLRNISWQMEIKSVNGKQLDVKTKLPLQYEELGFDLKKIAANFLQRGSVSVFLEIKNDQKEQKVKINDELMNELMTKALDLYFNHQDEMDKPRSSDILAMRGVVEIVDNPLSDDEQNQLKIALLADFEGLCQKLAQDRKAEGSKIKNALLDILQKIEKIVGKVEDIANEQPAKIKAKLDEQLKMWLDDVNVSEERLAQEVVFLVTRADIREEIDRLKAHIKTAEELLGKSEAVGRRLDFLCQELNREANTTCSKSSDVELTSLGMELKALIEQFREQVQNIE